MRLIDADAVVWAIRNTLAEGELRDTLELRIKDIEPKRGRWIAGKAKHLQNGEVRNLRKCSECGACYFVYDTDICEDAIPNYCPNCGARMEGTE